MAANYVLRIYKMRYCFENYDDSIYRVPEEQVNPGDIRITRYANTKADLIKLWEKLLVKYEGYTYSIRNLSTGELIVGGVFDPNDIEIIEEE